MRGFDHATILSPSFHGLRKERLAQWPSFCGLNTTKNPRRYFQKNWVGVCGTLSETLTLFQTKICDFPHLISDLIENFDSLFQTWSPLARRVAGARDKMLRHVHGSWRKHWKGNGLINSRLVCTNHTLFQTQMVETDTLFQTKTAKKNIHFGAAADLSLVFTWRHENSN